MTNRSRRYKRFFGPLVTVLERRGFKLASRGGWYYGDHARGFFVDESRFGKEIRYGVAFGWDEVRVELIIDRNDAKAIFDDLRASKTSIEAKLALRKLRWDRKSGRRRTRIATVWRGTTIEDDFRDIRKWAIPRIKQFKKVFDPLLLHIVKGRP